MEDVEARTEWSNKVMRRAWEAYKRKNESRKCRGNHHEEDLVGWICRVAGNMGGEGRINEGCSGVMDAAEKWSWEEEVFDDLTGDALDQRLVREAREEEMNEFKKYGVYVKVPVEECWKETGKNPIGVRWVDVNKGDRENPKYRSRLVAKEIKKDKREDLFAATPPIEAKKGLLSTVAHWVGEGRNGIKLDFYDVRRAYFHAAARRKVYVELPGEDYE